MMVMDTSMDSCCLLQRNWADQNTISFCEKKKTGTACQPRVEEKKNIIKRAGIFDYTNTAIQWIPLRLWRQQDLRRRNAARCKLPPRSDICGLIKDGSSQKKKKKKKRTLDFAKLKCIPLYCVSVQPLSKSKYE